jgi:Fe-S cluster biogenesis protein NfuA
MNDSAPTRRGDLAGLLGDLERLEEVFAAWDQRLRHTVEAYRRAIEALHGEALRRLIRALRSDPAALAALKNAVADEVVYAVLRHHGLLRPSLNERIETALATVRPMLASHGGDVRLVNVAPPRVEVEMIGACGGCASSNLTFHAGIEKAIRDACPDITEVVEVSGLLGRGPTRFVSPFVPKRSGETMG